MRLEVERPRRPEGPGNLQAWARDTRYAAAAGLAEADGARDRHRPHRRRPGRDDPLPAGLLAEPPGAARDARRATAALVRPLLGFTREQTTAYCEERGLRLARRPEQRASRPTPATGSATGSLPALAEVHPAAGRNVLRTAELLRDEAEVLDALVDAELDGSGGAPRGAIALERLGELPPALRRLVVQRLADRAAGRPVAGRRPPRRRGRGPAPHRAARCSTSAAASARSSSAAWSAPSGTEPSGRAPYLDCRGELMRDRRSARPSSPARNCSGASPSSAPQISRDYEGRDLFMVGVLKGAVLFLADLMRSIDVPCEIDFMAVSSYGSQTDSSGVVRILKDLDASIEGRHVLIVEDIIDSGLTLQYLMRTLNARSPASLEVCALLTKPERLRVDLSPRYVGFEIPNRFAVGYGLDHAQHYRNLEYVAALDA